MHSSGKNSFLLYDLFFQFCNDKRSISKTFNVPLNTTSHGHKICFYLFSSFSFFLTVCSCVIIFLFDLVWLFSYFLYPTVSSTKFSEFNIFEIILERNLKKFITKIGKKNLLLPTKLWDYPLMINILNNNNNKNDKTEEKKK